jgi:hypothetical protein
MHWLEGGERRRAAACFAQAGERRWARAQAEAAARCAVRALLVGEPEAEGIESIAARVRLLADALEASRRLDEQDVMTGLERIAEASSGDAAVRLALERTLEALRKAGGGGAAVGVFARAACGRGALGDYAGGKPLRSEALALAGNVEAHLRSVRYASAKVAFWAGEPAGAIVKALSSTMLPDDPRERLEVLLILATALVSVEGKDALEQGLDYVTRAEALVSTLGNDPVAEVHCEKARFMCLVFAGEHVKAADAAEAAVLVARRSRLRYEECAHLHNIGQQYVRLGLAPRARAALFRSNEIADDIGAERIHRLNEVLLACLDPSKGPLSPRLESLADGFRTAGDRWYELQARYWIGTLLASRRDVRAHGELTRAHELARELEVRAMVDECEHALASLPGRRS